MKYTMRRTAAGISWEQWHRMVVMQSLQMMVMSGVVRRADLDPPLVHLNSAQGGPDRQGGGDETSTSSMAEPGWFARIFFSREYLLRHHH
jgi:hypothetical protein